MDRRHFILAGLGALLASRAALAEWPEAAFTAESPEAVIAELGGEGAQQSDAITITAPDIAENGAVVPVSVETTLPKVSRISIIVNTNPLPLTSSYEFSPRALPYVSTRVKMLQTSDVVALVESDGKSYVASREVKVTIGGCGG